MPAFRLAGATVPPPSPIRPRARAGQPL